MGGYSNKKWACPYYIRDGKLTVTCEAGSVNFPDRATANRYMNRYCADARCWQLCTLASALTRYYEEKIDEEEKNKSAQKD